MEPLIYINHHPRKISIFLLFSAYSNSSDLHEPGMQVKNIVQWKVFLFSLKVQDFVGFSGHVMDMSNVLPCVLKFHRTGLRMIPTKARGF